MIFDLKIVSIQYIDLLFHQLIQLIPMLIHQLSVKTQKSKNNKQNNPIIRTPAILRWRTNLHFVVFQNISDIPIPILM